MPVYTTTLPNGQSVRVMGPANATPETIQQAALQIAAQRAPVSAPDTGERNYSLGTAASKAFSRGTEQIKSSFGDVIPAMVGNALGFDEFAERQIQEAEASQELINRKYRAEFQSYKDVKGIGDALKFGIETIGEQLPNLGTMVGAGGIAGLGARVGTRKLAADALAKQGIAGVLAKRQAARTLAQRQATAQGVGIYMGSYSLNAPEIFQNIYQETGELTTGTAVLYGAVAAALDSVLPNAILKNITPIQKAAIAKAVLKKSGTRPGLAESVFKGFTKGAGSEALTEGAQEALSISAENFVAGNSQIFDSEDWERIMESSVRGAVAGGTFRGASEPFGRQPAERPEPIAPATEGQSDLIDSADAANIEIAMEAKKEAEESAKIEANIVKEEAKAVNEEVETQETLIDASAAEEAAAIESDQLAAVAAAKTSDQRLTKEEAAGFRGTLDAFDQMMFDVESEQLGGEENVLKNDDATGRAEVDRSGFEVPVGAADSVTGGIARDDGGEVEPSGSTLPAVGVGEGVVNPALTDQEKALKNKTARKYLPRINEAREKLRLLEEAELAKVSGDQAATYKLMAEQEARRKKAFMKINDEGMAEFEASRVETVTVEAATIPQDLIKDYKYLEVISEDPKLAVESNRIGASLVERMKGFLETIKQPATEENLAKLQARLNTEPVQESRADTEGTGQVYYRGTSEKFDNVAGTGGVIYFSPNREEAELVGGNIVTPYRLKVKNTFNINNKAHLKKVLAELSNEKPTFFKGRSYKNSQREIFKQALEDNPNFNFAPYEIIEEFAEEIEGAGFDSFFVNEQAGFAMGAKNIGVFDASLLEPIQESRTDTEGEFSVATELSPEIQQVLEDSIKGFEMKMPASQMRKMAEALEKIYKEKGISYNGDSLYFMASHLYSVVKNEGKITTNKMGTQKNEVIIQNQEGIPIAAAGVEVYPRGKRTFFPKRKNPTVVTDPAVYIPSVGSQNPQAMDALLEEVKRIARENNIRHVVMEDVTSEGAIKAFKRRGFVDAKKEFFEGEALVSPLSWRGQKRGELQKNVVLDLEGAQESRAAATFTGAEIAQEAQEMGSDQGGLSDFTAEQIAKENYNSEEIQIQDIINADKDLKQYIDNTSEVREFEDTDASMDPIISSTGEVIDGYNRIHAAYLRGDKTISVFKGQKTQESRADTKGTGQTTETVTAELVQEFGPNVIRMIESGKLVIVNSVDQLPANIKMSSTANGGYDAKTQTSYIIANRSQKGRARRILLHEIGEHHGLARMVGKDYIPLLNRLKTLRKQNAEVQAIFDEVQRLYPELTVDSTPFLQEVMAKLGERAPNNSLFRRIVGAVKNFLRRLGLYDVNKFSDADIQDMILNSLRISLAEATSTNTRGQVSGTPALQMSKNVEAKAELDVKRIMKIVGSNMYTEGDAPAVTVKELLQNAADSLKSLLAKGTIEKGKIEITIGRPFTFKDYGNDSRVVSVKDNGKGMTPKTLSTTFITLGGSDKDPDASGGFGVAKAQFLFGNEGINVVTMNDGIISELISTGEALNKSVEAGIPLPEGTIMAYSPKEYNELIIKREEARTGEEFRISKYELNIDNFQPYMRLFPEGRGTIVEVKIPETYDSLDTEAAEPIYMHYFLSGHPELSDSPLFSTSPDGNVIKKSNIEVIFQGANTSAELVPIGANFPSEDFATNIDVEFPWGTAKIIVSKEEVEYPNYYDKNIVVLSNGLFQFRSVLRINPKERLGDLIQRKFYIDIKSKIQPGEKGYPFANNRQSLIPEAERDLELMKSYLQKEFGQLELINQYNSIVNTKFQILKKQKDGSVIAEDIPSLAKTGEKNAQAVIETKQDLEVTKDGKLIDKKTKVPVLTAKDIAEVQVSAEGLQIEKGIIPTDQVIIHDNLETSLRDIGEDQLAVNFGDNQEFVPITQLAREKFGSRFDKFMNEIGEAFLLLRNQVIMLGNLEKGQSGKLPSDYSKLADNVVGISFDVRFRGVNIGGVPFQGVFVNPGAVEFTNSPEEAGVGMVGTMLHEMAHFYHKNHEASYVAEFQRLMGQLEAAGFGEQPLLSGKKLKLRSLAATKKSVIKSIKDNEDIFKFLNSINQPGEIYEYGKSKQQIRPIGERFETSDLEVRNELTSQNMAETGKQGRTRPERVSRDTRKGDTAERREQQRKSVSPESKTTQESRVADKNIQFSREEPPGGFNPTQYSKNFAMAESVMKKMPVGSADYMEGLWNKITQLPTTVRKIWMGMLGLQAMSDLYGKYLPSIKTLINVLERRAATVEATRAEVDVLGNLGMAIINPKGKKRKRIKYNEKTGAVEVDKNGDIVYTEETTDRKYTPAELNRWEQTTYELSRDNIDPRNPDNRDDPLVKRFFNLPAELQALSIAYTTKYEQYGDQLIEAFTKNVGTDPKAKEEADRVVIEFKKNRLNFYHPFRRKGDYVLSYVPEKELQRHYKALENIENMEAGLTAAGQKVSAGKKALLRAEEYKRHAIETQTPRFETKAEYLKALEELESGAEEMTILKSGIYPESRTGDPGSSAAVGVMEDVLKVLTKKDADGNDKIDAGTVEQVRGLFLDLLPSQAIIQQTRKRAGTGGYIEDVTGGFIDLGARMATQIANLKFIPEIDKTISSIKEESNAAQLPGGAIESNQELSTKQKTALKESLGYAAEELSGPKARSFFHNPVAGSISSGFAYLSYLTSIAGNVSSALVNATQLAIIVYPSLVAEYGFSIANKAMADAFKLYFSGGKDNNRGYLPDVSFGMKDGKPRKDLSPELQKLYDAGLKNSVFRRGVGYELTEMRKTNSKDFTGIKAKFDALMGWMFQNTERMNREVTYIAGYLAATEKAKQDGGSMSFEQAEAKSRELTRRTHGTALPEIGPRFFQTGFGKVAFTFKRYGHSMMHLLIKGFNDAYRGETKEVRAIARKQLLGVYGASFAFAGLQGVPLYGFTQALSEAMYAMFGDDDEPYDFEESTRDIFGDIGYRGPLNKLLNLDIASRTGFANLIWREDPRRISEVGLLQYVAEQGLGPAFSYGLSVSRGLQDMGQGNLYRGFEQITPAFVRNPLKGFRYATEGALNRKGAEIVPLNPYDGFMQIFGFTNEDLSLQYARNQSMKQAEKNYNARRSGLLTMAYLARKNGDTDLAKEVQEKIDKFNRSTLGSTSPILGDTLNTSFKTRERNIDKSVGGINLNEKVAEAVRKEMGS